jgi:hypothetical protein
VAKGNILSGLRLLDIAAQKYHWDIQFGAQHSCEIGPFGVICQVNIREYKFGYFGSCYRQRLIGSSGRPKHVIASFRQSIENDQRNQFLILYYEYLHADCPG